MPKSIVVVNRQINWPPNFFVICFYFVILLSSSYAFWCFLFQMLFRGICSLMLKLSTNSRQLLPAPKKKIKRTIEPLHPATQHHRVPPPRNHPTQLVHTKTTTQHRRLHGKKTCMASKHEKCKMQQHSENSFLELGNSTEIVKKIKHCIKDFSKCCLVLHFLDSVQFVGGGADVGRNGWLLGGRSGGAVVRQRWRLWKMLAGRRKGKGREPHICPFIPWVYKKQICNVMVRYLYLLYLNA